MAHSCPQIRTRCPGRPGAAPNRTRRISVGARGFDASRFASAVKNVLRTAPLDSVPGIAAVAKNLGSRCSVALAAASNHQVDNSASA